MRGSLELLDLCSSSPSEISRRCVPTTKWLRDLGFAVDDSQLTRAESSPEARAAALGRALQGDADVVVIVSGGTRCVETAAYLSEASCRGEGKAVVGTSDATHVAVRLQQWGHSFVYGLDLVNLLDRYPEALAAELVYRSVNSDDSRLAAQAELIGHSSAVSEAAILGGHVELFLYEYMRSRGGVSVRGRCLFLEHHTCGSLEDFLQPFRRLFQELVLRQDWPDAVLIGHCELGEGQYEWMALANEVMQVARQAFPSVVLGRVDHYTRPVPLAALSND